MNWTDFIIAIKQGLIPSKKELVDGTTTVGNANKLGGKGASEYFLKSGGDIDGTLHARGATDTPIYNHANSSTDESYIGYAVGDILRGYIGFKNGKAHIHNVGDIATTADLANYLPTDGSRSTLNPVSDVNNFLTGVGLFRDGALNIPHGTGYWLIIAGGLVGTGVQLAIDLFNNERIKMRNCASGTWGAWGDANVGLADYLLKSGGDIFGWLQIIRDHTVALELNSVNSLVNLIKFQNYNGVLGYLGFANVDYPCVYGSNGQLAGYILHTGNVGDYALIKNGGVANNIYVKNVDNGHGFLYKNHSANADYGTYLKDIDAQGRESGICVQSNVGELEYLDVNGNWHDIHHDGNSAKVVVSSTPLTAEGSVRVW